jgi:Cu(I)/Ag(I) efflux system membrane fusion protein
MKPQMHRPLLVALTLTALAVAGGAACRAPHPTSTRASVEGGLDVQLAIEPDPPIAGKNRLSVDVRDEAGKPVDGAAVHLGFEMPPMGSMAEMKGEGETQARGPGRYQVTYQLPAEGDWRVAVDVAAPGHPARRLELKISPPRKGFVIERGAGREAASAGAGAGKLLDIPPERQQLIGVTFGTVSEQPLSVDLRAPGHVKVSERSLADITLRFEAFVQRLFVAEIGKSVRAGQPLLVVYSPEILAAEQELLDVERGNNAGLVNAAKRRLRLWDISDAQLAELERRGHADGTVTVSSTIGGVVLEKNVVAGSHVEPGDVLYRVGNLGRIWVEAQVYESDAPFVAPGQEATVDLPALGSTSGFKGKVIFVAPTLDEKSRTLTARIELDNPDLTLKPGMFATVDLQRSLGTRLAVPDRALLLSGGHRYAFVERAPGKLQPVEVQIGAAAGEWDEVRSGLSAGDRVVLNAAFLVSSEARLRDALPRWSTP